tara:strand:- start:553 stop:1206 length:654 start_codon:yes stop_codon:yes gene_type:complete
MDSPSPNELIEFIEELLGNDSRLNDKIGCGDKCFDLEDFTGALGHYQNALAILSGADQKAWWDVTDSDRSKVYSKIGLSLLALGDCVFAMENFGKAIRVWIRHNHKLDPSEASLLMSAQANCARLLTYRSDDPHRWAREQSAEMLQLLELAPPEETGAWAEMRGSFREFHEQWLRYAVRERRVDLVPEILAVLQGQDVAADVLDRLVQEAKDGGEYP